MEEREDSDRDKWSSGEAIPEREREREQQYKCPETIRSLKY
jgi:hypothetical protein